MNNPKKHLLTIYTQSPLHVGSGTSVDVVDLPIIRERITGFPFIPASSLKGVLLQRAREVFDNGQSARSKNKPEIARVLFGDFEKVREGDEEKQKAYAGCVQIMEAKLLAFPVRSLAGCFAWLTCPTALARYSRDTGYTVKIPSIDKDCVIAGSDLVVDNQVVLEEYALNLQPGNENGAATLAETLKGLCEDPLWEDHINNRLAIVHDENFQHFVATCTEIVARIAINPETRVVVGAAGEGGGALFNQENVPSETLFYSVLTVFDPRRPGASVDPNEALKKLLEQSPILQIGGDETTGHGLCQIKRQELIKREEQT